MAFSANAAAILVENAKVAEASASPAAGDPAASASTCIRLSQSSGCIA
jgi:hypothetical protein